MVVYSVSFDCVVGVLTSWMPRRVDGEYMDLFGRTMGQVFYSKGMFLTKRRDPHFFRVFQGFGVSAVVLQRLRSLRIERVVILWEHADGSVDKLAARVVDFYERGTVWQDRSGDFQRILPLELFGQTGIVEFCKVGGVR